MLFGLDGVELGLIITFSCLFIGIMSGFPVAFAIGGAGTLAFGILAVLDTSGYLIHAAVDTRSDAYMALVSEGVARDHISLFRFPDLPTIDGPVFEGGWEQALNRKISFVVNRMNERVFAGQSIETLLAVLMFVLMGVTLERSKIAEDLLTSMARVFGPLPGGLAVSVVIVGAFLAASTGIVGATVVTMGLLSLPTMLRNGYSPELATGVIAASGTLGQIIPPSIVIVLLGSLAGDLYAAAQENRAALLGCRDALTYLGQPAALSTGVLFKAALLPGIFLAFLYGLYAFVYAMFRPQHAPPIPALASSGGHGEGKRHSLTWFLFAPVLIITIAVGMNVVGFSGSQSTFVSSSVELGEQPELRTNVSEQCQSAMIEKHGQDMWDRSVTLRTKLDALKAETGGVVTADRTPEEVATLVEAKIADAAPLGTGLNVILTLVALTMAIAYGVAPRANKLPLIIGSLGVLSAILVDVYFIKAGALPGGSWAKLAVPFLLIAYGMMAAGKRLGQNEMLRVVFPPLVLIVAVLGSILGGITNPTPAAALGAAGAIMLAAYRRLKDENASGKFILQSSFALVVMLLVGVNFDLRTGIENIGWQNWIAIVVAQGAYFVAMAGLLFACLTLLRTAVLTPVVRETAKVTSMVFAILIGSQMLNLVIISFGGEDYIQDFLKSFDEEWKVFLIVMIVLFFLGFVLDFLEIIYIVIPIVGPVIYGGSYDPKWVTILIAINLQTSFLTPPFGFALFYLRGVAPPSVTTGHIYRGVVPFVLIQVAALAILWAFPVIVTIVPNLLGN